jgi:alanine-glyoxylate transaminase/serine-glyoxylate transaminase/serine-pyruvate transaminase
MDPYFIGIMDELKSLLQKIMGTDNRLTLPVSGTGSAGMETCFVNLVEKGDPILILTNGVFGKRMQDVATRLGGQVDSIEFPWGTPVQVEPTADKLKTNSYRLLAVVHAETSTGVCNPVAEIGALVRGTDTLFLVDTVTSLGGMPVAMDGWGADALYSGTQKCLSCPPGLAPVSFSDKAVAKLQGRSTKVPNWYLDLTMIMNYWEGAKRVYHHTAPINMIYGLYRAAKLIIDEGLDTVYARHEQNHHRLVTGLEKMGLTMLADPECRLPMLNAVKCPEGIDEASVRNRLLEEHRIEIGAGLGPLAAKIWRVGLMGHTARAENVDRFLDSLKQVLSS